ncbi:hypothetical protein HOY82DRAFT_318267 [Tuber indicum]|nr:hypothetical protein HOY82DRAFT_318267 [Tuber indicum]
MTTPHRGLPPPQAMALPSPTQASSGVGQLPHQWHSSEDMYKTWLLAKLEEERRKAEEEKTKQEKIREETRKLDLEMLRESSRFLIPPPLIPIVLAGGGTLKGAGGEWLNDYVSQHMGHLIQQQQQMVQQQPQHHQQQVHQMSSAQQCTQAPVLRRETRVIGQQGGGQAPHPQQMGPPPQAGIVPPQAAQAHPPPPLSQGYNNPAYPPPPGGQRSGPPQPPPHPPPPPPMQQPGPLSRLPKLDTNDQRQAPHQPPMHTGIPPTQMGGHPGPPIQHTPQSSQQPPTQPETSVSQSPSIFFHHWQPPPSTSVGISTPVQATASPQGQLGSPFNRQPQPNQITGPEYTNSPKKRKTSTQQGPSAAAPQPFSPSFPVTPLPTSTRTRRGHSRHRSDTAGSGSRGYEPYPKTTPRGHRGSIGEGSAHGGGPPSGGNGGGSHHPHDQHQHEQHQQHQHQHQHQQHQHQQHQQHQHQHHQQHQRPPSVPPHPLPQHRPFSPKSEGRRETYQPPATSQPPPSEGGEGDNRSKSRNSNGRD